MELLDKTVQVPKESSEVADAVCDIVIKANEALSDGFQIGEDITAIIGESIAKLPPALDGFTKIPSEMKEDGYKFAMAWAVAGEKIWQALAMK